MNAYISIFNYFYLILRIQNECSLRGDADYFYSQILDESYRYFIVHVRTATSYTFKMAANLTQILYFEDNFHKEFELFSINNYANNGGHFWIVSIIIKTLKLST